MIKFEKVNRFANIDIKMPVRKTANAAGYDMVAAEDTIIQPYEDLINILKLSDSKESINNFLEILFDPKESITNKVYTLDEISALTKGTRIKPTLVSTGMKCKLDPDTYLELSVRSSSPLKYWIIMANGVGIIDADYYNNSDNEGEIFFQLINLSPFPIKIQKGEAIGQGIIKHYLTTEDDNATGVRVGGLGSTGK